MRLTIVFICLLTLASCKSSKPVASADKAPAEDSLQTGSQYQINTKPAPSQSLDGGTSPGTNSNKGSRPRN